MISMRISSAYERRVRSALPRKRHIATTNKLPNELRKENQLNGQRDTQAGRQTFASRLANRIISADNRGDGLRVSAGIIIVIVIVVVAPAFRVTVVPHDFRRSQVNRGAARVFSFAPRTCALLRTFSPLGRFR